MRPRAFVVIIAIALAAACAGTASSDGGCGPTPYEPFSLHWLAYPMPSAKGVPVSVGELIVGFAGAGGPSSSKQFTLSSKSGPAPLRAYTAAPSPLPSPLATPLPGAQGRAVYFAVPVPTLSPSTTYTATYTYSKWADNPPKCSTNVTQTLGSFTTK
jgi:hypothetical protein